MNEIVNSQYGESLFLRAEEIRDVTGRVRYLAQIRWFLNNGIVALQDADGRPVVSRAALSAKMGAPDRTKGVRATEPNWSELNAKSKTTGK